MKVLIGMHYVFIFTSNWFWDQLLILLLFHFWHGSFFFFFFFFTALKHIRRYSLTFFPFNIVNAILYLLQVFI